MKRFCTVSSPTHAGRARLLGRRGGFTITELLIAISILTLMLFLINDLFNRTTRAMSDGIRQSTVLSNARAVQDRLTRDATAMLGPDDSTPLPDEGGGYIVIINKQVFAPVKRQDGTEVLEAFRIDQLVFMADTGEPNDGAHGFRASAPRNAGQYGSDFRSPYALIRYGHGRRVNRDGTDNTTFTELGQPFVAGDPVASGRDAGSDRFANDWILTRQAVLFAPKDNQSPPANELVNNISNSWYADTPLANAQILFNSSPIIDLNGDSSPEMLHNGYCDVVVGQPARVITDSGGSTMYPGFIEWGLDPADPLGNGWSAADITDNYLDLSFVNDRLRVNPAPSTANNDFPAWTIGQLHGIFAPNCSDFIVQFAADVDNDGEIDRLNLTTGDNTGSETSLRGDPIFWYDMQSLDLLDGSPDGLISVDPWLGSAWTGTLVPTPLIDLMPSGLNRDHGDYAFIFRYDDAQSYSVGDTNNSKWPYLIRIRYRLHDAPGRLESNASFRENDDIDQDDDGNDVLGGGTTDTDPDEAVISGVYFEQIIRVPRP